MVLSEKPRSVLGRELYALELRRPGHAMRPVSRVIKASWERCEHRGLPITQLDVPFTSAFDTESRLTRSAGPVLRALHSSLANEPISIMLADETGLVLTRLCNDRAIIRALDDVALAPGSTFSEPAVGTNGFGLALANDAPALVAGDDHYNTQLMGYTCAGVPIHDPLSGGVVGALSLTTWSSERNDLLLALAGQTAMNIEAQLAGGSRMRPVDGLRGYRQPIAQRPQVAVPGTARFRLSRFEIIERDAIVSALERNGGAVADAAEDLGFSRATMYRKVKRYGIKPDRTENSAQH
jgi:transcriptional regulator of acetoin/glycerol metabolism